MPPARKSPAPRASRAKPKAPVAPPIPAAPLSFFAQFQAAKVTVGLPKIAAVILGLIGGAAQAINYSVISASSQLHAAIAVALYFLIAGGIPPLTGDAFKAALHLPAWISGLIGAGMGAALLTLASVSMPVGVHEAIAAGITVLSAWGFSAAVQPVPLPKG